MLHRTSLWPVLTALLLLWITVIGLLVITVNQNEGHLIYALDDPYIHMAMAKHFIQHGVWGVTPYEFSSSSSSPLWTLIISGLFLIFGIQDLIPLVLTTLVATLTLIIIAQLVKAMSWSPYYLLAILLALVFFTPFPVLIFTGMEHILHVLLSILFAYLAARSLAEGQFHFRKSPNVHLLWLAPLLALVRYEGLFLVFVVCVLLLLRRRIIFALGLGLLGLTPLVVYGYIAVQHGWFWLPNSVLLKAGTPDLTSLSGWAFFVFNGIWQLVDARRIFLLFLVALFLFLMRFLKTRKLWEVEPLLILIFLLTTLLHIIFAKTGWFYRYEAYLIALGIFTIALAGNAYLGLQSEQSRTTGSRSLVLAARVLAAILIIALGFTGLKGIAQIPRATQNIYNQQFQMSVFLQQYYANARIAADDVGFINYLTDLHCLDLVGLGSREVAQAKLQKVYQRDTIYELAAAQEIQIAITHDQNYQRFYGGLPEQWFLAGQWTIPDNLVCGGATISFYAVDTTAANELMENLLEFSPLLPKDVEQEGTYLLLADSPSYPAASEVVQKKE